MPERSNSRSPFEAPHFVDALLSGRTAGVERIDTTLDSGLQRLIDEYQDTNRLQARILKALKPDGVFLAKAFQGEAFEELLARLKRSFAKVKVVKPPASRGESSETYVLARNLRAL